MKKLLLDACTVASALMLVWAVSIAAFGSATTQADIPPKCWDCIWQQGYCATTFFGFEGCRTEGFECVTEGDWCADDY